MIYIWLRFHCESLGPKKKWDWTRPLTFNYLNFSLWLAALGWKIVAHCFTWNFKGWFQKFNKEPEFSNHQKDFLLFLLTNKKIQSNNQIPNFLKIWICFTKSKFKRGKISINGFSVYQCVEKSFWTICRSLKESRERWFFTDPALMKMKHIWQFFKGSDHQLLLPKMCF